MKPMSTLLAKILGWFFLNMVLVAVTLSIFFAFQPEINLHAIFGQQGDHRLRTAGQLIAHDLRNAPRADWSSILSRHADIHGVDFTLVLAGGSRYSSLEGELPGPIRQKISEVLRHRPPRDRLGPPHMRGGPHRMRRSSDAPPPDEQLLDETAERKAPPPRKGGGRPHLRMRTQNPTQYWSGIRIRVASPSARPMPPAMLLASSDSITGNGFFFDPLPWMVVAGAVILISVLLWIPMVRNISRPLSRMTHATEEISKGRFDVAIQEPRKDEIGRLADGINHMAARLSAFVKGQKRFLGDVSHELGSPVARIQFGLGALEQRVDDENRQRVKEVMEDVDHMSTLVNELLAFSRADITSEAVILNSFDLLPLVQTAVRRERTPEAEISIHIDSGIRVHASAELLTRALSNLIRNAIKYAGHAGPITVTAKEKDRLVDIEIRDKGPGVPDELLNQLFEPFFRPEASRDRDTGGVGLGLAIVKTCVEACNGRVTARNHRPRGFAVIVSLPVSAPDMSLSPP